MELNTPDEMMAVIRAIKDGKAIQFYSHGKNKFLTSGQEHPSFLECHYRVKPQPIERWVNVYGNSTTYTYASKEQADSDKGSDCIRQVHLIEDSSQ